MQSSDRTHVLAFTTILDGGGAEMHMVRLANALDRSRYRVSVAVYRRGGSYESFLAPDIEIHTLPAGRGPLASVRASVHMAALLRRERFDVVCTSNTRPAIDTLLATQLLAPTRRLPGIGTTLPRTVVTVQIPLFELYTQFEPVRGRVALPGLRTLLPTADRIVAISGGVAEDVSRISPRLPALTRVIFNASVDDRVLALSKQVEGCREGIDGPMIVACGRLVKQKGFSFLIDAFAKVASQTDATLVIIGEGPLREPLTEQIRSHGLEGRVRLIGFKSNPYAYMAAADVFVLSSLWEGLGMVLVEAMACGTAVLSTTCPHGPTEIITDGADGLLVPPADPDALAGGLLRLLGDDALRNRLATAGKARAADFHADAVAVRYGKLFDDLTSTRGARDGAVQA